MRRLYRSFTTLLLLLLSAAGSLRAATTVTIEDYVCYGGDYIWVHDGEERTSFTNVTGSKSYTYYSEKDGCNYKLSLQCRKASSPSASTAVTLHLGTDETYTWNINGHSYLITEPGVYMDTTYHDEVDDCIDRIYYLVVNGDTTSYYCKIPGETATYVWDRFPELKTTSSSTTLKKEFSTIISAPGTSDKTVKYTISNKVTRKDPTTSTTAIIISEGEGFEWFGKTYHESGTYRDTLFGGNMYGCDSIGVLNLTICGTLHGDTIVGICPGVSSVTAWNETFTDNATRQRTYVTKNGCDSIVTLHVVHSNPADYDFSLTVNEDYYWPLSKIKYTSSGSYSVTVPNECGCDSLITLHLTVMHATANDTAATICEGGSIEWHGQTYSAAGVYPDPRGTDTHLHLGVLPIPQMTACPTQYMDQGKSAQLYAKGTDYYVWEDASTLSSPWSDQPVATPPASTTYTVKGYSSASGNAVINGDFENGYSDFTTELTQPRTSSNKFGTYIITNNPSACTGVDAAWNDWGSYKDHTKNNGTGNYMVVDGFTEQNKIVWQQTVSVVPGNDYIFSAWFVSLKTTLADPKTAAKLQFFVNGEQLGDPRVTPSKGGVWGRYYEQWSSGTNTTAVLTIKNQNLGEKGNDFGLDDISFQALGPCYFAEDVDVIVNRYFDRDTTLYSSELPITWEEHTITYEGDYKHRYMSTESGYADSIEVLHVHILNDYPVHIYPDCASTTVEERDAADSPTETFTLHVSGKDDCTQTFTGHYRTGDLVLLKAHEEDCYRFVRWSDGETDPFRTITMDEAKELTAHYEQPTYSVTVNYNSSQGHITKP